MLAEIPGEAIQRADIMGGPCFDIRVGLGFTIAFVDGGAERGDGDVGVVHEPGHRRSVV